MLLGGGGRRVHDHDHVDVELGRWHGRREGQTRVPLCFKSPARVTELDRVRTAVSDENAISALVLEIDVGCARRSEWDGDDVSDLI